MWSVMIADDEPYIREGLEKLIDWRELGCELVFSAENGQKLLEEIKRRPPDIVIVDIRMPLLSGLEVAQYIYENSMDIQVILLTAYSDFQYAHEAIRCQVSDYIVKTSALEDIPASVGKIKAQLEKKRLARHRMLYLPSAGDYGPIQRFIQSSFEGLDYHRMKAGEHEICMVFTVQRQGALDEIVHGGERLAALCKSFLGLRLPVFISPPYEDRQRDFSIYKELRNYLHSLGKNGGEITVCVLDKKDEDSAAKKNFSLQMDEDDLFCRMDLYIRQNYTKKMTLDDIAEGLHASRSYLSRLYKQRTGINLFDAINEMRMEKAKEYMKEGRRRIYEIAELTGFDDTAYFSRVFKKYAGMSPKEFEAANRKTREADK